MSERVLVCTPWHNLAVRDAFLDAWNITPDDPRILLREDVGRIGCGAMKNKIIAEAVERRAEIVIVLDSDCHPAGVGLKMFIARHVHALEPVDINDFLEPMTTPIARGIPYLEESRSLEVPVAASLGFWQGMPDRDAARQLVEGVDAPMQFKRGIVYQQPTMLCGMNIAFRPKEWLPWCSFIDVSRLDDVFMSWLWSKEAARRGYCFNFAGPDIRHTRQSDVFNSLIDEAKHLKWNETGWRTIWKHPSNDYDTLRALIPV